MWKWTSNDLLSVRGCSWAGLEVPGDLCGANFLPQRGSEWTSAEQHSEAMRRVLLSPFLR